MPHDNRTLATKRVLRHTLTLTLITLAVSTLATFTQAIVTKCPTETTPNDSPNVACHWDATTQGDPSRTGQSFVTFGWIPLPDTVYATIPDNPR